MARTQVADGGDGLQIWSVTENILSKESDNQQVVVLQLGVGRGANNRSP
jgi:hypothetical protein